MLSSLLIPLVGTVSGSATVFFMKNKINPDFQKLLSGFAAGVMTAASVWSLLIPSIEMSNSCSLPCLPALIGFSSGILFLIATDALTRRLNSVASLGKIKHSTFIMALAVTVHNIPEGMAVGVMLAAASTQNSAVTAASAAALSLGIAIQNFPEGAIISLPLKAEGKSKTKAFIYGSLSGIVEPVFGFLTLLVTNIVIIALPYLLSFAAGAMIYVVAEELIPEAKSKKIPGLCAISVAFGFAVMMSLDVLLS